MLKIGTSYIYTQSIYDAKSYDWTTALTLISVQTGLHELHAEPRIQVHDNSSRPKLGAPSVVMNE